jgi:hypothetical protein
MQLGSREPGCTHIRKGLEISQIEQSGETKIICNENREAERQGHRNLLLEKLGMRTRTPGQHFFLVVVQGLAQDLAL